MIIKLDLYSELEKYKGKKVEVIPLSWRDLPGWWVFSWNFSHFYNGRE